VHYPELLKRLASLATATAAPIVARGRCFRLSPRAKHSIVPELGDNVAWFHQRGDALGHQPDSWKWTLAVKEDWIERKESRLTNNRIESIVSKPAFRPGCLSCRASRGLRHVAAERKGKYEPRDWPDNPRNPVVLLGPKGGRHLPNDSGPRYHDARTLEGRNSI
jgi:hypothetical protein